MKPYQRKDHLYFQAKDEGYRSRAAYKLIELDKKYRIFKPTSHVLDLGSFPGGWLQVACQKVSSKGIVIGTDLVKLTDFSEAELKTFSIRPIILNNDIRDDAFFQKLEELSSDMFDVVMSDMSPQLSGIKFRDAVRSAELVELALEIAKKKLKSGGKFIAKIFPSPEADELFKMIKRNFQTLNREYLDSTRKSSTEYYIFGTQFVREFKQVQEN